MRLSAQSILQSMQGLSEVFFTDRTLVSRFPGARHLRGGRITREDSKELKGTPVQAFGRDDLNNLVFVDEEGIIRQHLGV